MVGAGSVSGQAQWEARNPHPASNAAVKRAASAKEADDDDDVAAGEEPVNPAVERIGAGVVPQGQPKHKFHHEPNVQHNDPLKEIVDKGHAAYPVKQVAAEVDVVPRNTMSDDEAFGKKPLIFPGASATRLHGQVGVKPDGTPGFTLKDKPTETGFKMLAGNGFNARLSDSISLDREASDFRMPACKSLHYDLDAIPETSVVIVFYNEAFSPLMRSVHSVLNRSPPQLLKEIVLVDDGSDKPWLQDELVDYVALLPKVRLVRQSHRSGLVEARLRGIREARAPTFIVLDSHIEVQPGWLEPLLDNLRQNPHNMVMPQIDSIDPETFEHKAGGIGCTLGFIWNLIEHGMGLQEQERQRRAHDTDSIRSPTMAGGLFGGWTGYFWELGGYDEEWGYWGTENLELSFRLWQCGGRLECEPCSRVYHIFRKGGGAYSLPGNHVLKNKLRTATLWMDEFGWITRDVMGNPHTELGPLKKMIDLRERLQCKSFKWYLETVFPESPLTDLRQILARGAIKNVGANVCLDH
ncbi:uncharacterized protein MONBRDRAFT_37866, partial [Monosiga brevicollis MX1]